MVSINIAAPTKGNVHKSLFFHVSVSIGFETSTFKLIVSKKIVRVLFSTNLTK